MVAPFPIAVEFVYVPAFASAASPMNVLNVPVVFVLPALSPTAVFPLPVHSSKALSPIAVIAEPATFENAA